MKNKILSRYYVIAEIVLESPLSLSGGMEEYTDSDVMRDGEGRLVIPGLLSQVLSEDIWDKKRMRKVYLAILPKYRK